MKYLEILNILKTSSKQDWTHVTEEIIVFNEDVNLHIEQREIDFDDVFLEPWAMNHPNKSNYRIYYDVFYNSTFIKEILLISVDGHRAELPLPDIQTNTISLDDYNEADIITNGVRLDEYIKRSGLTVEGN